jgi:hypothetical protein
MLSEGEIGRAGQSDARNKRKRNLGECRWFHFTAPFAESPPLQSDDQRHKADSVERTSPGIINPR